MCFTFPFYFSNHRNACWGIVVLKWLFSSGKMMPTQPKWGTSKKKLVVYLIKANIIHFSSKVVWFSPLRLQDDIDINKKPKHCAALIKRWLRNVAANLLTNYLPLTATHTYQKLSSSLKIAAFNLEWKRSIQLSA